MRLAVALAIGIAITLSLAAQGRSEEATVKAAVQAFYATFNAHAWDKAAEFATEDWNHIDPFGGRTRERAGTIQDLRRVHSTFLKGVSDTVESMDVRFATADVAVVTAVSRMSTYTPPSGKPHVNERYIRTFVVVKRGGRWQIMQDQNTIVAP